MKFKAYDIINKRPINLFRITISSDGSVMGVIDLNGEQYGMHQVELKLTDNQEITKTGCKPLIGILNYEKTPDKKE
jgi:hypothetical protein